MQVALATRTPDIDTGPRPLRPGRVRPRVLAALLLGGAGLIHGALIPEHFDEGLLFGTAFVVMTAVQLTLAVGLLVRPGARTDALGRYSTVLLIALYLFTRVVPVPGQFEPKDPELFGTIAVAVELSALVALSRLPRDRVPRLTPRGVGALSGLGTLVALLLTTSSVRWIPVDLSSEYGGGAPAVIWRDWGWSTDSPRLTVYLTNHLVLFGSLLTLALVTALAAEVGVGVARGRRALLTGRCERRRLFWMPAFLAAPVCCGAPLFGVVGPAAFAWLVRYGWAPLAIAVSLGALSLAVGDRLQDIWEGGGARRPWREALAEMLAVPSPPG